MQLPSWVRDIFRRLFCHHCKAVLSEQALRSIGTGLHDQGADLPPKTTARLEIRCPNCTYGSTMLIDVPLDDLLHAVRILHQHGVELLHEHHGQVEASDDRGVKALGPMDEAEIRTFLQTLKRLSFRRDTKSFQRWIKQLEDDDML